MQNAIPSYYLQRLQVYRRKGCNDADAEVRRIFDRYIDVNIELFHIAHWNKMEAGYFIKDLCCLLDLADCLDQPRKQYLSRLICVGIEFCLTNKCKARWFSYFLESVMSVYIDQERDGSVIFCLFCLLDYCSDIEQDRYYTHVVNSDMSKSLVEYYLDLLGGINKDNQEAVFELVRKLVHAGARKCDFEFLLETYCS